MRRGAALRAFWHVFPAAPTLYIYHANHAPPTFWVFIAAIAWSLFEIYRLTRPEFNERLLRAAGDGLRRAEASRPTGTCFYLWGVATTLYMFTPDAAVAGILCLALADPAAAIVGQSLGRWRGPSLRDGKSCGGFAAAWAVASFAVALHAITLRGSQEGRVWAAPAVGLCAALAESYSVLVDDNLALPVLSAACAGQWLVGE